MSVSQEAVTSAFEQAVVFAKEGNTSVAKIEGSKLKIKIHCFTVYLLNEVGNVIGLVVTDSANNVFMMSPSGTYLGCITLGTRTPVFNESTYLSNLPDLYKDAFTKMAVAAYKKGL